MDDLSEFNRAELGKLKRLLLSRFPWIGTDDDVEGSYTIDDINELFKDAESEEMKRKD